MNQDQLRDQIAELFPPKMFMAHRDNIAAAVVEVVAPLLADREAEAQRLRQRIHEAVDETQRRYAKYQSRCASFDTWSKWAREHAERMGDNFWQLTSNVHRLYVMSLHEEVDRLRREVEFEANGTSDGDREPAETDDVESIVYEFGNLNGYLAEQVTEKLFEFFDIFPKQPPPKRPVCVCAVGDPGARWSLPQCSVHPDRGGNDE